MNNNIYRTTTPTIALNIKNDSFDFATISVCHVTLESEGGQTQKIIENPEIDSQNRRILFRLTEEDTKAFDVGIVKLQIKMKLTNEDIICSKIVRATMCEILEEGSL